MAAPINLAELGLRSHVANERKLAWGSRPFGGALRFAALASVVQTGEIRGVPLDEVGGRVLNGENDRFGFGSRPPSDDRRP